MLAIGRSNIRKAESINFINEKSGDVEIFIIRNDTIFGKTTKDFNILASLLNEENGFTFLFKCKSRNMHIFKSNDNLCLKININHRKYTKKSEFIFLQPFYSDIDVFCDNVVENDVKYFRMKITSKRASNEDTFVELNPKKEVVNKDYQIERQWLLALFVGNSDSLILFVFDDIEKWKKAKDLCYFFDDLLLISNYLENKNEKEAKKLFIDLKNILKISNEFNKELKEELEKENIDFIVQKKLEKIRGLSIKVYNE